MTNYDVIVSQGPKLLAYMMAETKIKSVECFAKKLGVPFEVTKEMREEMVNDHYEYLIRERTEDKNS